MKCKLCENQTRLKHHKFCSQECYWKSLEGIKGKNAPNYRKVVGKSQVHRWLDVHYGRPKQCEGNECRKNSNVYDWALKKGKEYERDRKNFFRFCRSCHRIYDLTPKKKIQAIKNLWWAKGVPNPNKIGKNGYTK
jgi:hypothetical protein